MKYTRIYADMSGITNCWNCGAMMSYEQEECYKCEARKDEEPDD